MGKGYRPRIIEPRDPFPQVFGHGRGIFNGYRLVRFLG